MPVTDEDGALQAIETLTSLSEEQQVAQISILQILHGEEADPFVDIHKLFRHFNVLYFRDLLLPRVEVMWSPRLTLCAGICELVKDSEGKYRRIRLKLSEPLLKYRPRDDTVDTLLHEAIHAYFFITTSWRHARGDDGTGHGIGFQLLADAINNHGGYHITIYHTFHDEVDSYRTHIWKCDGPCVRQPPYFGFVKRSMNRAPGKSDTWWKQHERECGGTYSKIAEPEPTKQQLKALSAKERAGLQKNKLDGWIKHTGEHSSSAKPKTSNGVDKTMLDKKSASETPGIAVVNDVVEVVPSFSQAADGSRKRPIDVEDTAINVVKELLVECPICGDSVAEQEINQHLDAVHSL